MITHSKVAACDVRRILVVDDEAIVLKSLSETLREEGYEVVTARDAAEALIHIRQQQFAVIITDERMPRMSGLELLKHVRLLQPATSRILITAVLDVAILVEAINKGGIHRFIGKPWLFEELMEAVGAAVEHYKLEQEKVALKHNLAAGNKRLSKLDSLSLEEAVAKERELEKVRQIGRNIGLAIIATGTSLKKASGKVSRQDDRGFTKNGKRP